MRMSSKNNHFFFVHRYISGKIFVKIRSVGPSFYAKLFILTLQTDTQTDKQTPGKKHNLLGGANKTRTQPWAPAGMGSRGHLPPLEML